jgi:5-methylcytosine-specific restriction enzyme subunit McrC
VASSFGSDRTFFLTERRAGVVRLGPADVAFLLAHHPGRFELLPTMRRHRYSLTARGVVGVVVAPTCRIVVRPKIPLQNLFLLLDPTTDPPAVADQSMPQAGGEVLDFFARHLARRLADRSAAGLHRDYREEMEQGPALHGRLDLASQLRENPARRDVLHSRFDDLTSDVLCNQLPRAATETLLRSGLLSEPTRRELTGALAGFDGVSAIEPTADAFARASAEPLPTGYRPLLDLCRLLVEALALGERAGATPGPAFLLDMERIFEGYVTRGVQAAFAGCEADAVAVQPRYPIGDAVVLRPDLVLRRDGQAVVVVDAKWKRLPERSLIPEDLYQIVTYATALAARRAVLVYSGGRERAETYDLPGSLRVEVRTLCVSGSVDRCRRSLRRLGRELHRHP